MDDPQRLSGSLLVATPQLGDPNFRRTVVLVLRHDDDGTLGVVLNRPLPMPVSDVLPEWQDAVAAPGMLFQGGPVGLDGAMAVATLAPGADEEFMDRLVGPFGLVDLTRDPAEGLPGVTGVRVFVGHSGWAGGQLEAEIASADWLIVPAEPCDVATPDPDGLWARVLRRQGGELAIVATTPDDPRLN